MRPRHFCGRARDGARIQVLEVLLLRGALTANEAAALVGVHPRTAADVLRRAVTTGWAVRERGSRCPAVYRLTRHGGGSLRIYLDLVANRDGRREERVRRQVVSQYRAGATVRELTVDYGSYALVRAILHAARVPLRPPRV